MTDAVAGKIEKGTAYLAYWTVSWNRLYDLYDDPAEAFQNPTIDGLFDGNTPNDQIFPKLPATVQELFTPAPTRRPRQPGRLRPPDSTLPVGTDGSARPSTVLWTTRALWATQPMLIVVAQNCQTR